MRQVPKFLIIGNGRVAKHFLFYFSQLGLNYSQWSRQQPQQLLADNIKQASHVLLLISDAAIDPFIEQHQALQQKITLHCSGALCSNYAFGVHPLQSFVDCEQPYDNYEKITFVVEKSRLAFCELLPGLPNRYVYIDRSQKAYYHSLCVMANNFTTLLWQQVFSAMEDRLSIDRSTLLPFLQQTFTNLNQHQDQALTGPLVRKDWSTIEKNLAALQGDPLQKIYQAFVNLTVEEL